MADCCASSDWGRFFNRRVAARDARRYRRRGLTGSARALAGLAGDVRGASVLDVGGGVGTIELELLAAGAERATNVELSPGYEEAAGELLAERGLTGRVERRIADFVAEGDAIAPHDVVVMHRVVCCYPDVDALVGAAAAHARRRMVLTYPQERRVVRLGGRVLNVFLRLSGADFRTYVHPFERMAAVARGKGLELETRERHGLVWESAAFTAS
ncbi:MAG TPA: methyltransferase domain-containing protein [Gaiellaceae bacterium]|nr:methyltransferase domain-containing protein [Gaiellaceae bacterium]